MLNKPKNDTLNEKKKKRGPLTPAAQRSFLSLWLMSHIVGWAMFGYANDAVWSEGAMWEYWAIVAAVALPTALGQTVLLRQIGKLRLTGWFWATLAGWLFGAQTLYFMQEVWFPIGNYDPRIAILMLLMPAPILQWALLQLRKVPQAWLWLLANVVGTLVFNQVVYSTSVSGTIEPVLVAAFVQVLVTATIMLHLVQGAHAAGQAQLHEGADGLLDDAALQLQATSVDYISRARKISND